MHYSYIQLHTTELSHRLRGNFSCPLSLLMLGGHSSITLSGKKAEQYCHLTPLTSSCVWHHHRCVCVHCLPLVLVQAGKTSVFLVLSRNSKRSCSTASCGCPLALHSAGLPYKVAAGFFVLEMYDSRPPYLGGMSGQTLKKPVTWKQQKTLIFSPSACCLAGGSCDPARQLWCQREHVEKPNQKILSCLQAW